MDEVTVAVMPRAVHERDQPKEIDMIMGVHTRIPKPAAFARGVRRVAAEETAGFFCGVIILNLAGRLIPAGTGGRLRRLLYRVFGLSIERSTLVLGPITFAAAHHQADNIRIGERCFLNSHLYIDASAPVHIGNGVSIGHHVVIITTDHAIGPPEFRAGPVRTLPVTIGDGAWIAAGVTILPGVTVGHGAVVAAGAVVTKDVAPNTLVAGVPARLLRVLE